jgi:hypothetical protein
MRCHRQGQQNDVIVLNFLNKQNLADTRMLELINKRISQFDGIIGMSDTVKIGIQPQKVFTGARLGRREYSIDDTSFPKSGRHTLCGTLAKNIFNEIYWNGIPDSGTITVS